jgi:hypothetical protein
VHLRLSVSTFIGGIIFCFVLGVCTGKLSFHSSAVHAQERVYGPAGCRVVVPRSWGEFKGASAFGLAFQDDTGTLRFLQHPPCGSIDSSTDASNVDLLLQRK